MSEEDLWMKSIRSTYKTFKPYKEMNTKEKKERI